MWWLIIPGAAIVAAWLYGASKIGTTQPSPTPSPATRVDGRSVEDNTLLTPAQQASAAEFAKQGLPPPFVPGVIDEPAANRASSNELARIAAQAAAEAERARIAAINALVPESETPETLAALLALNDLPQSPEGIALLSGLQAAGRAKS